MTDQSIKNRKRIQTLESRVGHIDKQIIELRNLVDAIREKVRRR